MSRYDDVPPPHKALGHPMGTCISRNDHPRSSAKATNKGSASPSAAAARATPPIGRSSPGKSSQIQKQAIMSTASGFQAKGIRSFDKNPSANQGKQIIPRAPTKIPVSANTEARKQSEVRENSKGIPLKVAAVNGEVKLPNPIRKSAVGGIPENNHSSSPRKLSAKTIGTDQKGVRLEQAGNELCKDCKLTTQESVCFIANDGRVAACSTGAAVRHFHYCNSPWCAANPNYRSPQAPLRKYLVSKGRSTLPSQASKNKAKVSSCHMHVNGPRPSGSQYTENSAGMLAGDQNNSAKSWPEDEQRQVAETQSDCGKSTADQNGAYSCGFSFQGEDPYSVFMQDNSSTAAQDSQESGQTGERDHGQDSRDRGGTLTVDSGNKWSEEQQSQDVDLHCGTSITEQDDACSHGLSTDGDDPSLGFPRDFKGEKSCGDSGGKRVREASIPVDHVNNGNHSQRSGAVDQNNSRSSWSQEEQIEGRENCGSSSAEQNVTVSCGLSPEESSSISMRDLGDDKKACSESGRNLDNNPNPAAHDKIQNLESEGQEFRENQESRGEGVILAVDQPNQGEVTESSCGAPIAETTCAVNCESSCPQENDPSSNFMGDLEEDEQSCRWSGREAGSECSTPLAHDQKSNRDESGDQGSCCSTPVGYEDGFIRRSFFHHGDDELSCSDDNKEVTIGDGSTVDSLPGRDDFPKNDSQQSSNKQQRRRSNMSRMRRNYLNFLKEQEAETVRLRKQEIQERKQAGDWMLDCAIEEVLHKLAPNGETRVKVIVEAFETVMSHSDSESQTHKHANAIQQPNGHSTVAMHC